MGAAGAGGAPGAGGAVVTEGAAEEAPGAAEEAPGAPGAAGGAPGAPGAAGGAPGAPGAAEEAPGVAAVKLTPDAAGVGGGVVLGGAVVGVVFPVKRDGFTKYMINNIVPIIDKRRGSIYTCTVEKIIQLVIYRRFSPCYESMYHQASSILGWK